MSEPIDKYWHMTDEELLYARSNLRIEWRKATAWGNEDSWKSVSPLCRPRDMERHEIVSEMESILGDMEQSLAERGIHFVGR